MSIDPEANQHWVAADASEKPASDTFPNAAMRRHSVAAAKRKRIYDTLRIIAQLALALLIVFAVAALVLSLEDVVTESGIRIRVVAVPDELARTGVTAEVVANQILYRLSTLRKGSVSPRAAASYSKEWDGEFKVELPDSGIAITDILKPFHDHLGHATHVFGEIYFKDAEAIVTLRIGSDAVKATGPKTALEAVVDEAATRLYAWTQPYRYGVWLGRQKDVKSSLEDATRVFQQIIDTGPPSERVWARHGLAIIAQSPREQISLEKAALELQPHFLVSCQRIAELEELTGKDERALRDADQLLGDADQFKDPNISPEGSENLYLRTELIHDEEIGDFNAVVLHAEAGTRVTEYPESNFYDAKKALALVQVHDLAEAAKIIGQLPTQDIHTMAGIVIAEASTALAEERRNWESAIAMTNWITQTGLDQRTAELSNKELAPLLAQAYAQVGRYRDARAVAALIPQDVYDGWRLKGYLAATERDYKLSETYFREAIRRGHSLPRAYFDWGQVLLTQGKPVEAIVEFAEANRRGPSWAEPIKGLGDALAKEKRWSAAIAAYDRALMLAPKWVALTAARDFAIRRLDEEGHWW